MSLRVPVLNLRTALEQQEPSRPAPGKGAWGSFLIWATKCYEELHRKGLSALVPHKNIPNIYRAPRLRGPGAWQLKWDPGCAQPGRARGLHPRLMALPAAGTGCDGVGTSRNVTHVGVSQDVTRMACAVTQLRAASARGQGRERARAIPKSQRCHRVTSVRRPQRARGAARALPSPRELLGTAGHRCKAAFGQAAPVPAAWSCPQLGDKWVAPGINTRR